MHFSMRLDIQNQLYNSGTNYCNPSPSPWRIMDLDRCPFHKGSKGWIYGTICIFKL
jgi:hypothetical protein